MINIDYLFMSNTKVLAKKIKKCSELLEVVEKEKNGFKECIEAFKDATQEISIVEKFEWSYNGEEKTLALELKGIIKKIYNIVSGKYIYFADHEDHDVSMIM